MKHSPSLAAARRLFALAFILLLAARPATRAQEDSADASSSNNNRIMVLPAPGPVTIDGRDDDWDLSAGIWSYTAPTLVEKYSIWTHLMWDDKGIYLLGRYHDTTPMKNATRGKDFSQSWKADAMQTRVIFDDQTPGEHQMHINIFHSSAENLPYMIVHHGGLRSAPPYDGTGPGRPDQQEKYGTTMEALGGKIAFLPWPDGRGYTMEAFWPWSYLRTNAKPLRAGDSFVFGLEAMWGNHDGTSLVHRLVDNLKNDQVNRIFFFRARDGWAPAVLSPKGRLGITEAQKKLHADRLRHFVNYDTAGPVPIAYTLPGDRDVTIAIDDAGGRRVRNLFGQYPRGRGANTDRWDGLDDAGVPVPPGDYTATIVDHEPLRLKFFNSLHNAATPPWLTGDGNKCWGANHGNPTTAATRGGVTLIGFTGSEGATGLVRVDGNGIIQWSDVYELLDVTLDERHAYVFARDSWIARTVMRRYDLATGKLVLFENADKSPASILPVANKDVTDGSIALSGGKAFIHIKGGKLYRLAPATGDVEASFDVPGLVALDDRDGILRGLFADGAICELTPDGQKGRLLVTLAPALKTPVRFAVSQDGARVAVSDQGTNQVFICDNRTGALLRAIGRAYAAADGRRPGGKFIETDLIKPLGLDFDAQGRLWLAEAEGTCRRVTRWEPDGRLANQFWGAADYGATSGFPFTHDSTRFIAHGIEFRLDPSPDIHNRPTAETPLHFHPALGGMRGFVYQRDGREYAVTAPGNGKQTSIIIAKRDTATGVFRPVVRVQYGVTRPPTLGTSWIDLNDNGREDPGETSGGFVGRAHYWGPGWLRPSDFSIITPDQKVYSPLRFTPEGVPVYDFTKPSAPPGAFKPEFNPYRSATIVMDSAGNISDGINYATADGRTGSYPNPHGRHDAPAARRGLVIAPFRSNGVVENVPGIGSLTAFGGDRGEWFLMSMDGLYVSSILQDSKNDVTFDETFTGAESFGGFIWRDEKGRVLAQLGAASYRLVEITGLETIRKHTQKLRLTGAQIEAGVKLAEARAAAGVPREPDTLAIARVERLPAAPVSPDARGNDSLITGAATVRVQEAGDPSRWFRVSLAHNGKNLAISWQVNDSSPWKNGRGDFSHAFIGGDCVDLQLDIPGRGPVRLLAAPLAGRDTVVYWQKKAEKPDNPVTYVVAT
ncbi:MAG: hypothetical protein LBM92_05035, partial [Opitutaceae bacterium]|nr:hypothetical protein [Opitutaceae bacterium]